MKKLIATLLSLTMLATTAVPAFAADPDPATVSIADDTSFTLVPGVAYYFDLVIERNGRSYEYDVDEYKDYSVSVSKLGSFASYCEVAKISKRSDGSYDLMVRARGKRDEVVDFDLELTTKPKRGTNRGEVNTSFASFTVDNVYQEVYDGEFDADNYAPLIEFDKDVRSVEINFGDMATYKGTVPASRRKFNLYYTQDVDYAISEKNYEAYLNFIQFPGSPDFGSTGYLDIHTDDTYAYEVTSSGLVKLSTSRTADNALRIKTSKLSSYVTSDRALKNAISDTSKDDDSSTTPTTKPTTPTNPDSTSSSKLSLATATINNAKREGSYAIVTLANDKQYTSGAELYTAGAVLKTGEKLIVRRVSNGAIPYQWYIDAKNASKAPAQLNLGITPNYSTTKNFFEKWFNNKVAAVHFNHYGSLGINVSVAVKADLTGLNKSTLRAYHYDSKTNQYVALPNAGLYVDSANYLHINTNVGGDIIITDRALASK